MIGNYSAFFLKENATAVNNIQKDFISKNLHEILLLICLPIRLSLALLYESEHVFHQTQLVSITNTYHCVLERESFDEEDDSPSETEAREDAQTRALFAPFRRFLVRFQSLRLLHSLLTSTKCNTCSSSWLDSRRNLKFRCQACEAQKTLTREYTEGTKHMIILRKMKRRENAKYGSLVINSLADSKWRTGVLIFAELI